MVIRSFNNWLVKLLKLFFMISIRKLLFYPLAKEISVKCAEIKRLTFYF